MVTCRQLMELEIFHNVKLKAGRKGLDRAVTWVYAKHTKSITPWVHGGEFLLISGYEYGMNESELLELVDEAAENDLSGILVEGGINFKELPRNVIEKADTVGIPLFFVRGVVSFVDITQDVLNLIMENKYLRTKNVSLLDELLNSASLSSEDIEKLFYGTGISSDSCFMLAMFHVSDTSTYPEESASGQSDVLAGFSRNLQKHMNPLYEEYGKGTIFKLYNDFIVYLLYDEREEVLLKMADRFKEIHLKMDMIYHEYDTCLTFSSVISDCRNLFNGMNEASYTADLLKKKIFPEKAKCFDDIGSYQLILLVEDKKKLHSFRDRYLKKVWEADRNGSSQLMDTLREYLLQNGNLLQTSKNLFIHRNTLQYRLDRVEALTGESLDRIEVKRNLLNAFLIADVYPFE